jgi:3-oxoacyl-[acyl-carrier protein] reductase
METTDFEARTGAALVVGASGGLGAAIATLLLARGCRVAATYRRPGSARLAELAATPVTPATMLSYQLELTDADACARLVDTVVTDFSGLHTLVYAAGPHVSPEQFRNQLLADAAGFFNIAQPALPALRAAGGNIVAVTTAATTRFPVRDGLSAGPKGAVEALVRGLAAEEGRFGVRANCVGPGMLTDGMAETLIGSGDLDERALAVTRANIPLRRFGSAADIAEAVCFLASDRAAFISGQKLDVDGGYGA